MILPRCRGEKVGMVVSFVVSSKKLAKKINQKIFFFSDISRITRNFFLESRQITMVGLEKRTLCISLLFNYRRNKDIFFQKSPKKQKSCYV